MHAERRKPIKKIPPMGVEISEKIPPMGYFVRRRPEGPSKKYPLWGYFVDEVREKIPPIGVFHAYLARRAQKKYPL